jgi:hypothetical protein
LVYKAKELLSNLNKSTTIVVENTKHYLNEHYEDYKTLESKQLNPLVQWMKI